MALGQGPVGREDTPLTRVANELVGEGRGVLALDETPKLMSSLLRRVGAPGSWDSRGAFRELVLTTPDLGRRVSGLVLREEALAQRLTDGRLTPQALRELGLLVGARVDTGAIPTHSAAGETVTGGLDDLQARLSAHRALGVQFTRWRAVFRVGDDPPTPTRRVIERNAAAAAEYAAISQASGLVPMIEIDVLSDGSHSPRRCAEATTAVHRCVVEELTSRGVMLQDVVLVSSPVVAGIGHPVQSCSQRLAVDTAEVLRVLPSSLAGILISVGQRPTRQVGLNVASIRELCPERPLSFFVGRGVTGAALSVWRGEPRERACAQRALSRRLAGLATMSPAARLQHETAGQPRTNH